MTLEPAIRNVARVPAAKVKRLVHRLRESSGQRNERVIRAVHQHQPLSKDGLRERLFTLAFRGLVYPQIWEDPVVDMAALQIKPGEHIVTIASGGCNALSYLTAAPGKITAVDLNRAHIALNNLKRIAAQHLPSYEAFYRFFAEAKESANVALYHRYIAPHLDRQSRDYWESRDLLRRRRINFFSRNLYRYGLLGTFIGAGHAVARLHGRNPRRLLEAQSLEQQRELFDEVLAPLFEKRHIRWLVNNPISLYGLGIPPAQYKALMGGRDGSMSEVLRERLERLATAFDFKDNYFAWQAFGRRYPASAVGALPPYLDKANFDKVRAYAERIDINHVSMTDHLATFAPASVDCVVLLDAQDWMTDEQLNALWSEITRTARPGARVIFRTAGVETILPGRVAEETLGRWTYEAERSMTLGKADRSSIYGGFHLYALNNAGGLMEDHASAAEHMDSIYRVQRHFYDLTRKYYLLGRDRLINELRPPAGGNVLELGCGTGRNLVTAARRYPEARFHGVDISSMMLETAAAKVAAAALANRITLSPGDASTWSPPAGSAVESVRPGDDPLRAQHDSAVARNDRQCHPSAGDRRVAAHRRFRFAGAAAGCLQVWPARLAAEILGGAARGHRNGAARHCRPRRPRPAVRTAVSRLCGLRGAGAAVGAIAIETSVGSSSCATQRQKPGAPASVVLGRARA